MQQPRASRAWPGGTGGGDASAIALRRCQIKHRHRRRRYVYFWPLRWRCKMQSQGFPRLACWRYFGVPVGRCHAKVYDGPHRRGRARARPAAHTSPKPFDLPALSVHCRCTAGSRLRATARVRRAPRTYLITCLWSTMMNKIDANNVMITHVTVPAYPPSLMMPRQQQLRQARRFQNK